MGFRYPFPRRSLSPPLDCGASTLWIASSSAFSSWPPICSSGGPSVWPCCADHSLMISKTDPFLKISAQSYFPNCWFFSSVILLTRLFHICHKCPIRKKKSKSFVACFGLTKFILDKVLKSSGFFYKICHDASKLQNECTGTAARPQVEHLY